MSSNIDIETLSDSAQTAKPDERLREIPLYRKLLARPELGAISGTIFIFLFFPGCYGVKAATLRLAWLHSPLSSSPNRAGART